jgi:hypothetical protein
MDPLINPLNIVVDDIMDITLKPNVDPHMATNTSASQVAHPNPSKPKATKPLKSTKHDLDFDHASPIGKYLQCSTPQMPKIDVGLRLVIMVISMNRFQPPIKDLFTHQVTQEKRWTNQITIVFVSEQNYE